MDIIIFAFMFMVLLAQTLIFLGNEPALVIPFVISVVYILFRFWLGKKLPRHCQIIGRIVILIFLAISIWATGKIGNFSGMKLYGEDVDQTCSHIHKGEYDEATELIKDMERKYGEKDTLYMLSALNKLSEGLPKEAYDEYCKIEDKNDMVSIVIAELIYQSNPKEYKDDLYALYCTAADLYPDWEYIQLCTGVINIDFKRYQSAQHHLYNAYAINPGNPQTLFFLGLTYYKLGDEDNALYFFNESVAAGADDTIKSYIKYYLDEMDYWEWERT